MTTRYVAFLRGINVGGRTVKKEQFVAPFEAAGFTDVSTFIASGNVIGRADATVNEPELEQQLQKELRAALGFDVATFLRSEAEVAAVAAYDPFPDVARDDLHALHVTFLRALPPAGVQSALLAAATDEDRIAFHAREFYWLRHGRMTDTTLSASARKLMSFGGDGTSRNTTTIRKLAAKVAG
jgi:uncharacterized protein (DUF1697 family)